MRGFSGNTISVLHDGVRLGASTIVTRNLDTVGLERVEVLRGPASVLYGEGALGGATGANSDLLRWRVDLPLGNHWSLQNDLSWYQADRDFFYSDKWIYTPRRGNCPEPLSGSSTTSGSGTNASRCRSTAGSAGIATASPPEWSTTTPSSTPRDKPG